MSALVNVGRAGRRPRFTPIDNHRSHAVNGAPRRLTRTRTDLTFSPTTKSPADARDSSMVDRYRSVQAYFADAVDRATVRRGVQAGVDVRAYLVRMLERFGQAGRHSASIVEPLAMLVQRASQG